MTTASKLELVDFLLTHEGYKCRIADPEEKEIFSIKENEGLLVYENDKSDYDTLFIESKDDVILHEPLGGFSTNSFFSTVIALSDILTKDGV